MKRKTFRHNGGDIYLFFLIVLTHAFFRVKGLNQKFYVNITQIKYCTQVAILTLSGCSKKTKKQNQKKK